MKPAAMRLVLLNLFFVAAVFPAGRDWPVYGGDAAGTKYSELKQITTANVERLKQAWTFHTGDAYQPAHRHFRRALRQFA